MEHLRKDKPIPRQELVPVMEAARMLSIGKSKLYAMIARREFPAVDLGPRCLRVSVTDIAKYIQSHRR